MKHRTVIPAVLSLFLITACASVEQPDPLKEEVIILQKQLLELQQLQNETREKLDKSMAAIGVLSAKIKRLEGRRSGTAKKARRKGRRRE